MCGTTRRKGLAFLSGRMKESAWENREAVNENILGVGEHHRFYCAVKMNKKYEII